MDPSYAYSSHIQKGLDYLFGQALNTANGIHWSNSETNYFNGAALMAICRSHAPSRVVNVSGSVVNGWTYLQVAQSAVNYLAWGQISAGSDIGGWDYDPGGSGDQSVTGWVTLGLGYARDSFGITLPPTLISRLSTWIDTIQVHTAGPEFGGANYRRSSSPNWVNCYKTGHLVYMMELVGNTAATQRVQDALTYFNFHWNALNAGYGGNPIDEGWRGNPPSIKPSYMATCAMMKGLVGLNIQLVGSHDWFQDFSDVVVTNQNANGSWNGGGYGDLHGGICSTPWAMLTLLKATSALPPSVQTLNASVIGTTVTLNGLLSSLGSGNNVMVSFKWGTQSGGPYTETSANNKNGAGNFSDTLSGLNPGIYYYCACATGMGSVCGNEISFQVLQQKKKDTGSSAPTVGNPANISVRSIWTSTQTAYANQPVVIYANASNNGDLPGARTITLKINGKIEESKDVVVQGNAATPLQFTVNRTEPGTYTVDVNGQKAYFTVIGSKGSSTNMGMTFAILGALIMLALSLVIIFALRRGFSR